MFLYPFLNRSFFLLSRFSFLWLNFLFLPLLFLLLTYFILRCIISLLDPLLPSLSSLNWLLSFFILSAQWTIIFSKESLISKLFTLGLVLFHLKRSSFFKLISLDCWHSVPNLNSFIICILGWEFFFQHELRNSLSAIEFLSS